MMSSIIEEFRRYKTLAERAMRQVPDATLSAGGPGDGNSIAVIVWHIAGNLESRFTEFRTADGEKPWRQRDEEFVARVVTRGELDEKWERGWRVLFGALEALSDADLAATVTIRQQPLRIDQALHRSLAHTAYHVGQIVYLAKSFAGTGWTSLTIPKGESEAYNRSSAAGAVPLHAALEGIPGEAAMRGVRISEMPFASEAARSLIELLDRDLSERYPGLPVYGFRATDDPRTRIVVATIGESAVACGAIRKLDPGVAEIGRMFVRPPNRRQGIARAMLATLESIARQSGVRCLKLETGTRQPEAIRLYQSSGFTEIPLYGEYVGSPFSRCFEKLLA